MTDIAKTEKEQALAAIPEDLRRDAGRGTENIGPEDVRPPMIKLCQSGTPQRKMDDPKQIPGLNELDIFNDLSGEIYGRGPLKFVVLDTLKPKYMEYRPMDQGGGVIDFDVPPNDPRTQFTNGPDGKRMKPIATMYRDYLVWLPDHQELGVLTFKSTQLSVAVQLNGKMKLPIKGEVIHPSLKGQVLMDPPAWARTFSVTTVMERKDAFAWGNYNLKMEGLTPQSVRETCALLAETYAKKNIIVEHEQEPEPEEGSDTSFNPDQYERNAANAGM